MGRVGSISDVNQWIIIIIIINFNRYFLSAGVNILVD
jgi:hypothetical protein